MPQLQVVDLSPTPRTKRTPLETTLSSFSQQNYNNQQERTETDALKEIYEQYQNDGRNIEDAIMNIQTKPGISPTARVNSVNQLLQFQKHNAELQKSVDKKYKEDLETTKKAAEKKEAADALKKNNAPEGLVDLYNVASVGGQTKIIDNLIEENSRKKQPPGMESPEITDHDAGLTPRERVKRQDDRFRLQTPLVTKNSESLSGLENEELSLNLLDELTDSGKVGNGVNKLNINPKTGDLIIPQFATPEEQLFVKTVNDFTVKAKDSFGARVTNFELDRFMQRLPTLANSTEGRKLILRQMKLINKINQIEKKAIQNVFDQYGVRNIDYVDAENKARSSIQDQKEGLRNEYVNLEQLSKKEESEQLKHIKSKVKPGYTAMRTPEGSIKQFPEKNIPNLEQKGYKRI